MIVTQANLEITVWTEPPPESPDAELPVRLRIDGVDLFGTGQRDDPEDRSDFGNWLPLPPLIFAQDGLVGLQLARTRGRFAVWPNEYAYPLLIQMIDGDVAFAFPMRGAAGRVRYDVCVQAFDELCDRIQSYILELFPESCDLPDWRWKNDPETFRENEELYESFHWARYFDEYAHLFDSVS
jgi:hypothetical protein